MSGRRRPRAQKRAGRAGKPRTLRTRLVVASVVLIAVVCSVIGTVTTLALRSHLYDQLSGKLNEAASRAAPREPPQGQLGNGGNDRDRPAGQGNRPSSPANFVIGPGPDGTIAAKVEGGRITDAKRGVKSGSDQNFEMIAKSLTAAQIKVLSSVPKDNSQHKVELPGIGDYLVRYASNDTSAYYVAVPTKDVDNTLGEFFEEWGVKFDGTCIGTYCTPAVTIAVYVDGKPVELADAPSIPLTDQLEIAVVIGEPPATIPKDINGAGS